jgi:hypothetical protein
VAASSIHPIPAPVRKPVSQTQESPQVLISELVYGQVPPSLSDVARLLLTYPRGDELDSDADPVDLLLRQQHAKVSAQRIGVVLVHAMHRNEQLFDDHGIAVRKKAINLIDGALPEIYRQHGIDVRGADFEKIRLLRGLIPGLLQDIDGVIAELFLSFDAFEVDRNEFQRVLGYHRPLAAPFLPDGLQKRKLKELFDAMRDFNSEDGPELVGAYSRTSEALKQFGAELDGSGPFAQRLLSTFVEKLSKLSEAVYQTSSVTDPAELFAASTAKKYAFRRKGEKLRLAVLVENVGPGQALDAYIDDLVGEGVDLMADTIPLGVLMPGRVATSIPAVAVEGDDLALVSGVLRWKDSDGSVRAKAFELIFEAQRVDVDWDRLEQPYDLEPVSTTRELVGRSEILGELRDLALASRVGNAFLTGQKRVGKTSIVLTLRTAMRESESDLAVVYLEAGAFVAPTGADTVAQLGRIICEELRASDPRFEGVETPEFGEVLAPMRNFVGALRTRVPKLRVLVILDEFDELPLELYRRGPVGDALFLSLRTLAGQDHIGFILVGGEKMAPIVDAQGDVLNKFKNYPVSYFDRERHWDDFCDLVRVPVAGWLEITDGALVRLFELTAGHPYFTKMVCQELFKLMKRHRDAHATDDEIGVAADSAIELAGTHNFAHFWEDGIVASGEEVEEVSIRRRKLLLAYAESIEAGERRLDIVQRRAESYGIDEFEFRELLREFGRRDILFEADGQIRAKVALFGLWLARFGVRAITTTFTDPDAILHARLRDREEHVQAEEIVELVKGWGPYRGSVVTPEDVRAWLNQFDSIRAQRLMFRVLQGVRFYDAGRIRAKLKEAHGVVRRGLTQRIEPGRLKRDDIVISYLGDVGKSGVRYARLYADENGIYTEQVMDYQRLVERLQEQDEKIQALVLVDDLIGSGEQASKMLEELDRKFGGMLRNRNIKTVFVALAGFSSAERHVVETLEKLRMPVELHVCDPLGEEERCFSERSMIFRDERERIEARGIAESEGRRLQGRQPLGYRGLQAAVVFEESCPNSTLPILWDSKGEWRALFPRYHAPS